MPRESLTQRVLLCEQNAVGTNPVDGVKRPKVETYEGKTPALGDAQTRQLLKLPAGDGLTNSPLHFPGPSSGGKRSMISC